jgi:hypothetical protein
VHFSPLFAVELLVANDGWVPAEGGAANQPLHDLPPSHTRPPRSTAGNSSAGCLKTGPQYRDLLQR